MLGFEIDVCHCCVRLRQPCQHVYNDETGYVYIMCIHRRHRHTIGCNCTHEIG